MENKKVFNIDLEDKSIEITLNSDNNRKLTFNPESITWKQDFADIFNYIAKTSNEFMKKENELKLKAAEQGITEEEFFKKTEDELNSLVDIYNTIVEKTKLLFGEDSIYKITQGVDSLETIFKFYVSMAEVLPKLIQNDRIQNNEKVSKYTQNTPKKRVVK